MDNYYKEHFEQWFETAQDYPTKSLLTAAMRLYEEQAKLIELQRGKLDGISWSREDWDQ